MTLEDFLLKLNELRAVLLENLLETAPFTKDNKDINADWVLLVDMIRAIDHVKSMSTTMMGYFQPSEG